MQSRSDRKTEKNASAKGHSRCLRTFEKVIREVLLKKDLLLSQNKTQQTVIVLHINASNYTHLGSQGSRIQLCHQILAVSLLNQDTVRAQTELDRQS